MSSKASASSSGPPSRSTNISSAYRQEGTFTGRPVQPAAAAQQQLQQLLSYNINSYNQCSNNEFLSGCALFLDGYFLKPPVAFCYQNFCFQIFFWQIIIFRSFTSRLFIDQSLEYFIKKNFLKPIYCFIINYQILFIKLMNYFFQLYSSVKKPAPYWCPSCIQKDEVFYDPL